MSPHNGGGRPTRRAPAPSSRDRRDAPRHSHGGATGSTGGRTSGRSSSRSNGNTGSGGTRRQQIEREHVDDEAIEQGRFRSRRERHFELPKSVVDSLRQHVDSRQAAILEKRLINAAQAYERDRYKDALQAVKPVVDQAPELDAARELYGLTLYRLGRWRQAAKELRAVADATGNLDQYPVIADCERALGRIDKVHDLWDTMRREGVDKEILVEGRLVMSGALADSGELDKAIELLLPAAGNKRHADIPTLRQWYALANFYEMAGDLPRARELFTRVATQAPDLLDAPERLRAIR